MDSSKTLRSVLSLVLIGSLAAAPLALAANAAPIQIPETLKAVNAVLVEKKPGGLSLSVESKTPLTPEQWDAITALKPRSFQFNGAALDDAGMVRLKALDPENVGLNVSQLTGKGAALFGEMKSLKVLNTMHIVRATPEARDAFASHPALETFSSDGAFCIEAVSAPHMKKVDLKHGAAADRHVTLLANHPTLESVRLWAKGNADLTDAALASVATIPNLKKLSLEFAVFTYDGGLKALKGLKKLETLDLKDDAISEEDLSKLKADLPSVKVTFTPMSPEYRAQWDGWAAKRR